LTNYEEQRMGRFLGCLVGLAVGDALGAPLEFHPPGTFEPIRDMVSGGTFNLRAEPTCGPCRPCWATRIFG
jgi:ADP-ribosylglycohydrolase